MKKAPQAWGNPNFSHYLDSLPGGKGKTPAWQCTLHFQSRRVAAGDREET
jgi:hypothetical protein